MSVKMDVVVVGAGTGGSTTAYALARKGIKVALVDRKPQGIIGRKVCGDGIPKATFDNLNRLIDLAYPQDDEICQAAKGMDLIGPNLIDKYRLTSPHEEGYIVDRHRFGQRLLNDALDAGANLYPNVYISEPLINNDAVCGVKGKNKENNESIEFNAPFSLDATGSSAVLLKRLQDPVRGHMEPGYAKKDIGFAYREIRDLKHEIDDPDYIKIYFSTSLFPGGYFWIFPRGEKSVNTGLGVMPVGNYPSPKPIFTKYINSLDMFKDSKLIHAGSGYVPLRRPNEVLVANGFVLVGDSGSMVNPIHGGGIGASMDGGALAADTIEIALENDDFSLQALWPFNVKFQREIGGRYASLEIFKWLLITLNDSQLSKAMGSKIVADEDIEKLGMQEEIMFSTIEILRRLWRGKRIPRVMLRLFRTAKRMQAIVAHYQAYPDQVDKFKSWQAELRKLHKGFIPDNV